MGRKFNMGRFKPKRNVGRRWRRGNMPQVPVAVLPMTINWSTTTTAGGTHDIHPATASTADTIFRPSSCNVSVAAPTPTMFQIVLYASGAQQLATTAAMIGPTPRQFRVRSPKYLDYSNAAGCYWRFIVSGPAGMTGTATFTLKETLASLEQRESNKRKHEDSDEEFENLSLTSANSPS